KEQMTRNRDRLEENERTLELAPEDVAFFAELPRPLNVLVLAEDWCGDVIANLPVLGRLAEESGKLNLSIFLRDQNLDLMDQYLKDGQHRSIPVFAFFDQDFRELGHWIERPARISELQGAMTADLYANDPAFAEVAPGTGMALLPEAARDRLMQAFGEFRASTRDEANREVARELRELVRRGLAA
ncbi:MAG TPA: thioredoxin family protein, partial [Herpetosiphonaceae bacterium]|nr:thioredoxin family protein [Herpetosiphonaceae bacterium]